MKFDHDILKQLEAATASIQQALAGMPRTAPAHVPPMKDINPPPSRAREKTTGSQWLSSSFSNHAGSRDYMLYVPSTYAGRPMPLVVMLHGCTQDPDDFAAGTRMNELAEEFGFLVAYPAQSRKVNQQGCWNWFKGTDQRHGQGEPAVIAGIVGAIAQSHAVDHRRVFAAGLSAGGAMAAILGTAYPDLFAAVAIHSGLPVGAAHDLPTALQAMKSGRSGKARAPIAVPAIVFHGDRDRTVHPINGSQVLADAVASGSAPVETMTEHGTARGGRKYTRRVLSRSGMTVAEEWVVHGAGHTWSGGSKAGSHTSPNGPDASREMVRFFRNATGLV